MAVFKGADSNTMAIATPLIEQAAFMRCQLDDLQELIIADGVVEEYDNGGGQTGKKASVAVVTYNQMVKQYNIISKRIEDLKPKDTISESKLDRFMDM